MALKQEQERARSEVCEVAPDVLRLELDVSIPGLGHVNCYALLDSEGAALVDPGLPGPGSWKSLTDRLGRAGLAVKDIHTVLVTHSHPDHFGGAGRLAKEAGAKIVAHKHFSFGPAKPHHHEPEVSVDDLAVQQDMEAGPDPSYPVADKATVASYVPPLPDRRSTQTPWGGEMARPPWRMRLQWQAMRLLGKSSWIPTITDFVTDSQVLRLAGREWFVVHTPGHTEDHFCLHDPETGTFLAGDHVLPTITPHISGISMRADPLDGFFESLDLVARLPDVGIVLPAHGHPFEDLARRAEAIKRHHHERLEHIRGIGRDLGPATVAEFSRKLFRPAAWGAMAESETYAHLEHLRLAGDAECHEARAGKLVYATG